MTRESPWGPLAVADAHLHFFSHGFFAKLVAQKAGLTLDAAFTQLGWSAPPEDPAQLAEIWKAELDRHGVEKSVLIASVPGDEASVTTAVQAHPDRFFAFAMANPATWTPDRFLKV